MNVAQANRVEIKFVLLTFLCPRFVDQLVVYALMWPFEVIMIFEFTAKDIHVFAPENYKMFQTFLLNTLDESLEEGNRIW